MSDWMKKRINHGSKICAIITMVILLVSLFWSYTGYLDVESRQVVVPIVVMTVLTFAISFLLSFGLGKLTADNDKKESPIWWTHVMLFLAAAASYLIFQCWPYDNDLANSILNRTGQYFLTNVLVPFVMVEVLYLISNSVILATDITLIASGFLAALNYYVYLFRGVSFMPWDIAATKTAESVAGSYSITCTSSMIWTFLIVILTPQIIRTLYVKQRGKRSQKSLVSLGILIVSVILYVGVCAPTIEDEFWSGTYGIQQEGFVPAFLHYIPYAKYTEPSHYNEEAIKEKLDSYNEEKTADDGKTRAQNVIVIMNESLADFRIYDNPDFEWTYSPYRDSLTENTIKGNLYVPVFGGNTCNTEFEFLTGGSCTYTKGLPYQLFFEENVPVNSIVDSIKKSGYSATAFHPFWKSNWDRDKVYDDLDFDAFLDIYDMADICGIDVEAPENYYRNHQKEDFDFQTIISDYESKKDEPYFMFNVTMQNHGGYVDDGKTYQPRADLSKYGDYPQAEIYLGLIQETDRCFGELVEYFKNVDEPTIICMFGDHQPKVEAEFYEMLQGKSDEKLTQQELQRKYVTPFIIWANYDIDEDYVEKISANYLGAYLLKQANIETNNYQKYQLDLYERYPVINGFGFYDSEGNYYAPDSKVDKSGELLENQWAQYYNLHNKE